MSDAQHEYEEHHQGPIKTPKQLIVAVAFSFLVPIIGIILLVTFVASGTREGAGGEGLTAQAIAARIAPVGKVEVRDASDVAALKSGEDVFKAQCSACHATGAAGSPKFGDAAAWGPRVKAGFDSLLHSALKGKNAMPPQGGGDFSDVEIARAVVYMANAGGAKFEEPKVQAAAAPAVDASAAAPAANADATAAVQKALAGATAAAGTGAAAAGAVPALYTQVCQACHAAGVAGAPKVGDKAAWAPRVGQGVDGLTASAIKGKGAMPPKGGSQASDAEIKEVVTYMVNSAK